MDFYYYFKCVVHSACGPSPTELNWTKVDHYGLHSSCGYIKWCIYFLKRKPFCIRHVAPHIILVGGCTKHSTDISYFNFWSFFLCATCFLLLIDLYVQLNLLNWRERPLMNVSETNLLLSKLQELSLARLRPGFCDSHLPPQALSSVRLALATNLGRAILEWYLIYFDYRASPCLVYEVLLLLVPSSSMKMPIALPHIFLGKKKKNEKQKVYPCLVVKV